jgi:pyruvate carboxylase
MALFMVANNLTPTDVLDSSRELAFPESVIDLLSGKLGKPEGGFPAKLRQRVLKGEKPLRGRAGASLPPADLKATAEKVERFTGQPATPRDVVTHLLYPRVYQEFVVHQQAYSDTSVLPTPVFFYGLERGEEIAFDIELGKTLIVKFLNVGDPHPDGRRTVFFELNGQPREATVQDLSEQVQAARRPKADPAAPEQVAAPMPGMVVTVAVRVGDAVARGQKLLTLEALKMETTLTSPCEGKVADLLVQAGDQVEVGDLLIRLAP